MSPAVRLPAQLHTSRLDSACEFSVRSANSVGCRQLRELTDCGQTKLLCHRRHHMASKERFCPLCFRPSSRGAAPDQVACQPDRDGDVAWSHAIDRQLFVTQLDAQASSVRTLNEGETI